LGSALRSPEMFLRNFPEMENPATISEDRSSGASG